MIERLPRILGALAQWIRRRKTTPPSAPATTPASVEILMEALFDNCAATRRHAAISLGQMGEIALPAIAALDRARFDPNPAVREAAFHALHRIDPNWKR